MNKDKRYLIRMFNVASTTGLAGVSNLEHYIVLEKQRFLNYEYHIASQPKITDKQAKEMVNAMICVWGVVNHLIHLDKNDLDFDVDKHPNADIKAFTKSYNKYLGITDDTHNTQSAKKK